MTRWKVEEGGYYDGPIYDILDVNTGEDICSVYLDEKLANFIATGPELLKTLEIVTEELDKIGWSEQIIQEAKTVIAKAKGALEDK